MTTTLDEKIKMEAKVFLKLKNRTQSIKKVIHGSLLTI